MEEKRVLKKEFIKNFDGKILITDPCYILNDLISDKYYELEYKHMPSYKGPDPERINSIEQMIEFYESWLEIENENPNKEFVDEVKEKLEKNKKELEELNKEENFVDCKDIEAPAIDFLKEVGFTDCLSGYTRYGDWSCSVYSEGKEIGKFCADGGRYGIFYLDEVLKFNPSYDLYIKSPWTACVLDFKGEIKIKIMDVYFEYENKPCKDTEVIIEGIGNINFSTKQTGF